MDSQTTCAVSYFVKVKNHFLARIADNDDGLCCCTLFVDTDLVAELIGSSVQIQGVSRGLKRGQTCSKGRGVRRVIRSRLSGCDAYR